jgi:flagellar hook protein FlgE
MSILSAVNSALSGLSAESTQLTNISNNISDSSTVGYKEAETNFESLVLAGTGGADSSPQLAGVTAATSMDITTAGQVQTTGVATDIAINGSGFMVVNTSASSGGQYLVTQAGSFRPDAAGNLVNSGGYYLQGQPVDESGNPIGAPAESVSGLSTVNIDNLSVAAAPTTTMTFAANLPSTETAYAASAPTPSTSSVTYYDPLGAAQTLQFQFTPTQAAASGNPQTNTWTLNIYDSASATPATPVGTATLTFGSSGTDAGTLQSVTPTTGSYDPTAGTFTVTTGSGESLPITIGALNTASGITQLDGAYSTTNIQQNGSAYGILQSVGIGTNGMVNASFSNGVTRPIYQLDLAVFPNPDGLTPVAGEAFAMSPNAGVPQLFQPGQGPAGTTEGGALEGSNVDLSTQLTNLIETQRAYSSTAQVIQTADQMLDVINHLNQ